MSAVLIALEVANGLVAQNGDTPLQIEFGGRLMKFAWPVMVLAWMMMLGEQVLAMRSGQKADWWRPSFRIVGFLVLLGLYQTFAAGIISAVHLAGGMESSFTSMTAGDGPGSTQGVLAKRVEEFQKVRAQIEKEQKGLPPREGFIPSSEEVAVMAESMMTSLMDSLLYAITWFTFTFAAFAIFALKCLSGAMTNIILEVGPLMIAFAALPGLTSKYLSAWAMALIEVTAWGPISGIILGMLARVNAKSSGMAILEDANYAEHIVLNFVYAFLLITVPTITHTILSGAASAVGNTGMAAAMGTLAGAGKKAGAGASAAASAGGQAAGAAGGAAVDGAKFVGAKGAQAGERLGDIASGGATQGTVQGATRDLAGTINKSNAADAQDARGAAIAKDRAIANNRRGD